MTTMTPMRAVTSLRATVEGFAARHAAMRVRDGVKPVELLETFRRLREALEAGDSRRFAAADQGLHRSIVELANVPGLLPAWQAAFRAQNEFRLKTLHDCWPDLNVLFESHRPLTDAIAAGEPDAAHDAAVAHLDAVWFRLADATNDASLPPDPLSRASAYLAFHFPEPIRLPRLAKEIARCSAGHLARLFRDELGVSFSDYLIELRLQKASDLLRTTERPIATIAQQVGYHDPSRFAAHFRRRFGKTPAEYRKEK